MRGDCFRFVLLLATGFALLGPANAQIAPGTKAADHFPYVFSNFPWWTDSDLRTALKKKLPGLGEELERNSPMAKRMKFALTGLLAEKGVQATVQTIDPPMDFASQRRLPDAPKPSIVFSILSPPELLVQKLVLDNPPPDSVNAFAAMEGRVKGRAYSELSAWMEKREALQALGQLGYLSATVNLDHGVPVKDGDRYMVPVSVAITAGDKYHVAAIEADGGPLLQGRDLSPYFSVKVGDVAVPDVFGQLDGSLRTLYWQRGFQDVDFSGQPLLDTARALAFYELKVIPGPQYRLRSVRVENLDPTREEKVRQLLAIKVGDIYDAMAVIDLSEKLKAPESPIGGYTVSFDPKEDMEDRAIDLTLKFFPR